MKIFFANPRSQDVKIKKKILNSLDKVISQQNYILDSQNRKFENNLKSYFKIKYAVGVNSGTDALKIAIKSLGIKKNSEVIVPTLTATATEKVQVDIQKNLNITDAKIFKSSFNRTNLYYEVRPKKDVFKDIVKYVKSNAGKSGVIYCLSRKKVEETAEMMKNRMAAVWDSDCSFEAHYDWHSKLI